MDKIVAKQVLRPHGIPLAEDLIVRRKQGTAKATRQIQDGLGSDVVVKPARQGSAIGVSFASEHKELEKALEEAFSYDEEVLVEKRVQGKEITVAILERDDVEALPVIEITTPSGTWYDYKHRYTPGLSEHIIPARLPTAQYERTQEIARSAHKILGCRDLSRADFVVPEVGEPIILEVNTLPGMTPTSLYPDAARAAGISFDKLVTHLVACAMARKA